VPLLFFKPEPAEIRVAGIYPQFFGKAELTQLGADPFAFPCRERFAKPGKILCRPGCNSSLDFSSPIYPHDRQTVRNFQGLLQDFGLAEKYSVPKISRMITSPHGGRVYPDRHESIQPDQAKLKRILGLKRAVAFLLVFVALKSVAQTNLFVAADSSAPFKTLQSAIMSVPSGSRENPVVIHIAPGTYKELVYIQREKRFFKLVGDSPTNTIITFDLYAGITNAEGRPIGTFKTPSTTIDADDFTAENLTFENSAGPIGQALAIRVDGDRATFRNCRFLGWQDTILLNRGRQYFENCYICGHVDFIFGAATAWFENCEIHALRDGYLTAASTPVDMPFVMFSPTASSLASRE